MRKNFFLALSKLALILFLISFVSPGLARSPAEKGPTFGQSFDRIRKAIDQPNPKDYLKLRQRQKILEKLNNQLMRGGTGLLTLSEVEVLQMAEALAKKGEDRVLVILVEFGGPDTFTWIPGISTGDPYGKADPNEYTGNPDDLGQPAACNKIIEKYNITGPTNFTYHGPRHNQIERPLSASSPWGETIWTENFNPNYYRNIIFGSGVRFNYIRQDGSVVDEDFTGKSVKNYFKDLSSNTYSIIGDVVGWVKVPHSVQWYGADPCPGTQSGADVSFDGGIPNAGSAQSLVIDALEAVKAAYPNFNWAQYDQDGDGEIDRLWIIHAGLVS